jgi:hypothetical protein
VTDSTSGDFQRGGIRHSLDNLEIETVQDLIIIQSLIEGSPWPEKVKDIVRELLRMALPPEDEARTSENEMRSPDYSADEVLSALLRNIASALETDSDA